MARSPAIDPAVARARDLEAVLVHAARVLAEAVRPALRSHLQDLVDELADERHRLRLCEVATCPSCDIERGGAP